VAPHVLLLYALPAFALAIPTIPVYIYLPSFYAETMGLGLAVTGAALLVARLSDVVTDPLVGLASDRFSLRGSRRKPWIAAGAVLAGISLVTLLDPPQNVSPLFLGAWAVALYLGWTLIAVPYTAWGAELSRDYDQRSRITGAREAAQILGILVASAIPPAVAFAGGSERDGLAAVAWVAIACGAPAIALLLWRVRDQGPARPAAGAGVPARVLIREMLRNAPFSRLLSAWFINGLANGLPAVLFPLYLQYALQAGPVAQGALIAAYFVAGVIAMPMWVRLSRRLGKHRTWCLAMIMACLAFIWVPLLPAGAIGAFLVICIITGMAFGADLALPPSMQADIVDLDTLRTGQHRAGVFFAVWSMASKLALAAAVGIAFPALDAFGFRIGMENEPAALLALAVIYSVAPTVLKVFAIVLVWRHPITLRRHQAIRRRLEGKLGPSQAVK
jgi:Na+/melibiose symporter-like transporter